MNARRTQSVTNPISSFVLDIEPFFCKQAVVYADIGASDGSSFQAMLGTGLSVDRAVLIEADPKVFVRLQENVAARNRDDKFTCLNLAISDQRTSLPKRDTQATGIAVSGAKVISVAAGADADPNPHFEVEARRFDDLANLFPDGHVSILRINAEGQEAEVLRSCQSMLAARAVDVLYIEAGVTADSPQQSHFRDIDDVVTAHGYHLFRIYEPTHAWIDDLPVLQRFNVAYVSPAITAVFPATMTRELSRLRGQLVASEENAVTLAGQRDSARAEVEKQAVALQERFEEIALLTRSFEVAIAERDSARANSPKKAEALSTKPADIANRRKHRLLIGGLLFYILALAAAIPFII